MKEKVDLKMYPFVKLLIPFGFGIFMGHFASNSITLYYWCGFLLLAIILTMLSWRWRYIQSALLLLSVFLLGATFFTAKERINHVNLPQREITFEAVLLTEPVVVGKVIQTDLLVVSQSKPMKIKARILRDSLTNNYKHLHVGDGIIASARLTEPTNLLGGSFDYARWLRLHDYVAETFIYYNQWQKKQIHLNKLNLSQRLSIAFRRYQHKVLSQLKKNLKGDNLAIVTAMTIGDKTLLNKNLKEDYSITGASHVLALSGLHLTIIYGVLVLIMGGCSRLVPFLRSKFTTEPIILFGVWLFVMLVGASPSVVRSAMMLSIYSFVTLLNRERLSVNALSLTAFVMLVLNPYHLFDIGFQLSFASVGSIILFYPLLIATFRKGKLLRFTIMRWLCSMIALSVAAQLGTLPLIAYYFDRVSLVSLPCSLIAVPCTTLIIYMTGLLFLFAPLPSFSLFISKCLSTTIEWLNNTLHWFACLPGASMEQIHISTLHIILYYVALLTAWRLWSFYIGKTEFS